jgi:mercuric ion binding protein
MNKFVAHAAFAAVVIAFPAAMAADRTITLSVKNMDCAACPSIVRASLQAVLVLPRLRCPTRIGRHHL